MLTRFCLALLVLSVASTASAGGQKSKAPDAPLQLVGFTNASVAATGALALTRECQAEFPESRVCTSEEVLKTRSVPASLSGAGWVLPISLSDRYDVSGAVAYSCSGWNSPGELALTVDANGVFSYRTCNTPGPVACCGVP